MRLQPGQAGIAFGLGVAQEAVKFLWGQFTAVVTVSHGLENFSLALLGRMAGGEVEAQSSSDRQNLVRAELSRDIAVQRPKQC